MTALARLRDPRWRCPYCGLPVSGHDPDDPSTRTAMPVTSGPSPDGDLPCPACDGLRGSEHPVDPPTGEYLDARADLPPSPWLPPEPIRRRGLRRGTTVAGLVETRDGVEELLRSHGLWGELSRRALDDGIRRARRERRRQRREERWSA